MLRYAVMDAVHQVVASVPITIRRAALAEILDLRHAVLRPGLPRDTAHFAGDAEPATHHFGAFAETRCLGCASFVLNAWEGQPAWQLRGMATAPDRQRQGIGTRLLGFALDDLSRSAPLRLFWCNARVPAAPFYQRNGWEIRSEVFDIPTVGPHYKMVRRLG
jgi:GNAT superfamily N-acetyltransferase